MYCNAVHTFLRTTHIQTNIKQFTSPHRVDSDGEKGGHIIPEVSRQYHFVRRECASGSYGGLEEFVAKMKVMEDDADRTRQPPSKSRSSFSHCAFSTPAPYGHGE